MIFRHLWLTLVSWRDRRVKKRLLRSMQRSQQSLVDRTKAYVKTQLEKQKRDFDSQLEDLERVKEDLSRRLAQAEAQNQRLLAQISSEEFRADRLEREIVILNREIELMAAAIHEETERHRAAAEVEQIRVIAQKASLPTGY